MADIDDEIHHLLTLGPEDDEGDVEYKRMLLCKSDNRLLELETQMSYRVEEGNGECIYIIGVEDDGTPYGLTEEEYKETWDTLEKIAKRRDYSLRLISKVEYRKKKTDDVKYIYKLLVRENNLVDYTEIKIATCGNVDSGKSSCIGTLISGINDDGNGSSRRRVTMHPHELDTGRTSTISQHLLGYEPDGNVVNHDSSIKKLVWPELTARSSKIIKFIDLCGHTKYSKTTIRGILSNDVDYAIVTVGANMGPRGNTREHISICIALGIPVIVFVTKIDLGEKTPDVMTTTLEQIREIFSRMNKIVHQIQDTNDVITAAQSIRDKDGRVVPMFLTSNTRGDGISLIHEILNMLQPRNIYDDDSPALLQIHETFMPKGVGLVIGGFLKKGTMQADGKYYLGPMSDGSYEEVRSTSLHVNRSTVQKSTAGKYVCVRTVKKNSKLDRNLISRGMVLVEDRNMCKKMHSFYADIYVYRTHSTTIRLGYETMVHINSIRTVVKLVSIEKKKPGKLKKSRENISTSPDENPQTLCLGDRARILLRFKNRPYYISVGDRIFLAESKVKMAGRISEVCTVE